MNHTTTRRTAIKCGALGIAATAVFGIGRARAAEFTLKVGTDIPEAAPLKLARMSAERGGHIAPGIGDHPYRELGCPTNEAVIAMAAAQARAAGREIASPADAREMLAL